MPGISGFSYSNPVAIIKRSQGNLSGPTLTVRPLRSIAVTAVFSLKSMPIEA